jgi:hypothetical protein
MTQHSQEQDEGRDRGILSPADREFLRTSGENLSSEQSRVNARRRIRTRIRNAIIDCDLIVRLLSARDRQLIFQMDDGRENSFTDGQEAMITFLVNSLAVDDFGDFEAVLQSGVQRSESPNAPELLAASLTTERLTDTDEPDQYMPDSTEVVDPDTVGNLAIRGTYETRIKENAESNEHEGPDADPKSEDNDTISDDAD